MNPFVLSRALPLGLALLGLAGCLSPSAVRPRTFILTTLEASPAKQRAAAPRLGLAPVSLPGHLLNRSLVVRLGRGEVDILDSAQWAEQLDRQVQRALAANLTSLEAVQSTRLTDWRPQDVDCVLRVEVQQFDVDASGLGVLEVCWRLERPGNPGDAPEVGRRRLERRGDAPLRDPAVAVVTLSGLIEDFSRVLAGQLQTGR